MNEYIGPAVDPKLQRTVVALAMRVAFVALLAYWCFRIFLPFLMVVLWEIILVLAVAQLPPLIVLAPAMLYVASTGDSTFGTIAFVVWSLLVSVSDAVLKPLFMGRGSELPAAVILVGAIGGLLLHGLIGLFIGAVVFSLGYWLTREWLAVEDRAVAPAGAAAPAP